MQFKVFVATFPYLRQEDPDVTKWLLQTALKAARDERLSFRFEPYDNLNEAVARNASVRDAQKYGADLLFHIDNDMAPDIYPGACFWDRAIAKWLEVGECIIGVPYLDRGGRVTVTRVESKQNLDLAPDLTNLELDKVSRCEAARAAGYERVATVGSGLMMIDMRIFKRLRPPYFYYEYENEFQAKITGTADSVLCRNAGMQGVPVYVDWDCWAGHWKKHRFDAPPQIDMTNLAAQTRRSLLDFLPNNGALAKMA